MDEPKGMQTAKRSGAVFLALLFVVNVYRAATQSIACDEAFSWQLYISQPLASVFQVFDANNHLLATLSFWSSFRLFGHNELAMRIPTLAGCAWYFTTVLRISSRAIQRHWPMLIAAGAATLNPLVLDFMVAARGYGIALAALTYAILGLMDSFESRGRGALYRALLGICVSIGTNLAFLVPGAILIACFFVIQWRANGLGRAFRDTLRLALPAAVFFAIIYFAFPVHHATRADFYVGFPSAWDSLRDLVQVSFYHNGYSGQDPSPAVNIYLNLIAAIIAVALVAIGGLWIYNLRRNSGHRAFLLIAGTLCGSVAALIVAHQVLNVLYPVDRTGLYFLALMPLAWMTTEGRWPPIATATAALAVLAFITQWNTRYFYVWRFDADTQPILKMLEERARGFDKPLRLGISWPLEPSLNFYRVTRGYRWMAPVDRRGPNGDYDYYVVTPPMKDLKLDDNAALAGKVRIYEGPVSHTILAAPSAHSDHE